MDRNVRALTIALLCVLAVSLAAATLANPQQPPGAGDGSGGSQVGGGGTDQRDGTSNDDGMDNPKPSERGGSATLLSGACIPILMSPLFLLGLGGFVLVLGYAGYRRQGLAPAIVILFVLSTVMIPGWLMLTDCGDANAKRPGSDLIPPIASGPSEGGDGGGGGAEQATNFSAPMILVGLFVVALALAAVVYHGSRGEGDPIEPGPDTDPDEAVVEDEETLAAIGDVAGEAADRIERSVDVENEVYRAWHEMTTHLDVGNPQASTPTEFAAAARDAGMDDAHVDTLTRLFQDVRYGGAEATEDREERAVDALRAIESSYGGER
ncbi:DUF4129 domain-containing protein [Halobacterium zhouii]|uniref:DUF4129 domain-containing protein n=1 Tax=Halobacterium zhouii TaxID=2902624 RepID=UPI001E657D0D|nr:DUF4129 domain-containing protein [Halobacterium zhouii]